MSDLSVATTNLISLRTAVFLFWLFGETAALLATRLESWIVLLAGSGLLGIGLWLADAYGPELQVLARPSEPLGDGSSRFARRAWFGLRRRNDDNTPDHAA